MIRVDPKSVQRWLTGNTTPYPKHRRAIAKALNLPEHQLWPQHPPTPDTTPAGNGRDRQCDVIGSWGYADDQNAPDPVAFITASDGPIDVFEPYTGLQLPDGILEALAAQLAAGRSVRVLTDQASVDYWTLQPGGDIQILQDDIDLWSCWFIHAGDRMLLTLNLNDQQAIYPPPMLELTGAVPGGLYDRLTSKFQELWEQAEYHNPALQTPDDRPASQADPGNPEAEPATPIVTPTNATPPVASAAQQPPANGQRRWPGRTD